MENESKFQALARVAENLLPENQEPITKALLRAIGAVWLANQRAAGLGLRISGVGPLRLRTYKFGLRCVHDVWEDAVMGDCF